MAQVLTSVSGLQISAVSAGFAPTNSADVSSIASSYAESAASSKLDTTAQVVTATAGNGTYVTSINGMGLSGEGGGGGGAAFPVEYTAGNCSASLETGYFVSTSRPSLTLSSTSVSTYPRFIVRNGTGTASKGSYYLSDAFEFTTGSALGSGIKVLRVDPQQVSSKNFLLFGPSSTSISYGTLALNGADSQAYVQIGTGADDHKNFVRPKSISSWWDVHDTVSSNSAAWGQGGVDSATVSSIASSYAESAASSKADSSSLSSYALSSDVSGVIDTVSSNSASWGAGGSLPITGSAGDDSASYGGGSLEFTRYDTAGEPDIRTASLSPDQLQILFTYDEQDYTSMTLNETMLEFDDAEGIHVVDAYSIDSWNSAVNTVAKNSASWGGGATGDYVEKSATEVGIGSNITALSTSFAQGANNSASGSSFAQGNNNSAYNNSFAQGERNTSRYNSLAQGEGNSAYGYSVSLGAANTARSGSFAHGYFNFASGSSVAFGYRSTARSWGYAFGSGLSSYSSFVIGQYNLHADGWTGEGYASAAFVIGDGTAANARHDLMLVTKDGEITMYSSTADPVGTGIMSSIRAISAAAGGGDVYISGFGYNDTAISSIEGSALYDKSAHARITTVAGRVTNLSSDVSGTIDLVSTQSANWGGSALALSAGPGVSLTKSGNTLIAGLDETVLWSGFEKASGTVHSLSESMSNFERVKFVVSVHSAAFQRASQVTEYDITNNTASNTFFYPECRSIASNTLTSNILYVSSDRTTNWCLLGGLRYVNTALTTGVGTYDFYMNKIIGINRTAGV